MNIVSLGYAAANIASKFSTYPQYSIFKIDIGLKEDNFNKNIESFKTPEEFEFKSPDLGDFFSRLSDDEVLFICAGGSAISGMALRVLEHLKDKKITALYIRPDLSLLDKKMFLQEKITHGILQEYARSGLLEKIYLVDNRVLEKIIGDIPIFQYYDRLNELIASTLHMINVYRHIEPVISNKIDISNIARIATLGIFDPKDKINKLFYPLEYSTNQIFYYAYNKEELEKDGKLMTNIKQQIKDNSETLKVSFSVYATDYKENFIFCESLTHIIQGINFDAVAP